MPDARKRAPLSHILWNGASWTNYPQMPLGGRVGVTPPPEGPTWVATVPAGALELHTELEPIRRSHVARDRGGRAPFALARTSPASFGLEHFSFRGCRRMP